MVFHLRLIYYVSNFVLLNLFKPVGECIMIIIGHLSLYFLVQSYRLLSGSIQLGTHLFQIISAARWDLDPRLVLMLDGRV